MKKIILLILVLLSTLVIADIPEDCPSGMVSYWKLDQASGDVVDSYDDNNGTAQENVTRNVTGIVLKAFDFDGTSDFVQIPDDDSLDFNENQSFTISMWIKPDTINADEVLITKAASDGDPTNYKIQINSAEEIACLVRKDSFNQVVRRTTPVVAANQWMHFACVFNGSQVGEDRLKLYVNGTEATYIVSASSGTLANITSADDVHIGKQILTGDPRHFDGLIDEVAIFNRVLSDSEIQVQYENGLAGLDYCYSEAGAGGYAIPEFSTTGLILIAAMFVLLMVYRNKKK